MSRPKKTKINLDKDSLQELMQEIYNDCNNIMNNARRELNERKSRAEIEDNNDEYQIGKVNNETIKIIESTVDKKIALAKLQSQILGTKSDESNKTSDNGITEEDKSILRELFKEKSDNKNTEYDIEQSIMDGNFKNTVCDINDEFKEAKRQILELVNLNKTICNNLPDLSVPNLIPDPIDITPIQKIIDLLLNILSTVTGINLSELISQLVGWLSEQLASLSEEIVESLIEAIKTCYACKIEPNIPEWMYQVQPTTGDEGVGINIEINKIDFGKMFSINPNTTFGGIIYDGVCTDGVCDDINAFLWEVIQLNGDPLIWSDPINGKEIMEVRYYQDSPIAFTKTDGTVDYQNIDPLPRVFNVRIINNTYQGKSLITFLTDYFNSQQPFFNGDNVLPNVINLIFNTFTSKGSYSDTALTEIAEYEKALTDYSNTEEVVIDDSFYTFSEAELKDIKQKAKEKKSGVKRFKRCCGNQSASISFESLKNLTDDIKSSSTIQSKIQSYNRAIDSVVNETKSNTKNLNNDGVEAEFLYDFISLLELALLKLSLSPKTMLMLNIFTYLTNENTNESDNKNTKEKLKEYECVIRKILGPIINKIIAFLLPIVIRYLKNIVTCVIIKKIKEKNINYVKSKLSLLPAAANEQVGKINQFLGGIGDKVDSLNTTIDNSINSQFNRKGRFCE